MKYFLLWCKSDNRMMIADHVRKGWKTEQKTEASCWLEAKQNFALELTPLQKEILDAKGDRTEIGRRIVRHKQDARTELWAPDSNLFDGLEAFEDSGVCV